jgi:FAD/FMN-containing dehydrogenase
MTSLTHEAIKGRVIQSGDDDYDDARAVFYGSFDRRPALIARPADADDVATIVSAARESGLELAVRAGAHSVAGHSTSDGIVLDLRDVAELTVDGEGRSAWAGGGLTTGAYSARVGVDGLATGFGDTGSVGIGGLTLGGGVGFLVRKHGLAIDNLLAAEVVTADGQLVRTDAEQHPDLFWALRGGGGNFGVVTRFQFRLHDMPAAVGGMLVIPATPEVIASFVGEAEAAPEELSTIANLFRAPPMPFLPAESHGRLVLMAMVLYAGPPEEGERAIAPLRALADPLADMVKPMQYQEIFALTEGAPHPVAFAARNLYADGLDLRAAEAIVEQLEASTAPMAATQIRVLGGAAARIPVDATAYAHRGRRLMVNVAAIFEDPEEAQVHESWADGLASTLRDGDTAAYVNFLGNEGEARVHDAYPAPTWERLAEIKRRYDPENLFRANHNIPPA